MSEGGNRRRKKKGVRWTASNSPARNGVAEDEETLQPQQQQQQAAPAVDTQQTQPPPPTTAHLNDPDADNASDSEVARATSCSGVSATSSGGATPRSALHDPNRHFDESHHAKIADDVAPSHGLVKRTPTPPPLNDDVNNNDDDAAAASPAGPNVKALVEKYEQAQAADPAPSALQHSHSHENHHVRIAPDSSAQGHGYVERVPTPVQTDPVRTRGFEDDDEAKKSSSGEDDEQQQNQPAHKRRLSISELSAGGSPKSALHDASSSHGFGDGSGAGGAHNHHVKVSDDVASPQGGLVQRPLTPIQGRVESAEERKERRSASGTPARPRSPISADSPPPPRGDPSAHLSAGTPVTHQKAPPQEAHSALHDPAHHFAPDHHAHFRSDVRPSHGVVKRPPTPPRDPNGSPIQREMSNIGLTERKRPPFEKKKDPGWAPAEQYQMALAGFGVACVVALACRVLSGN